MDFKKPLYQDYFKTQVSRLGNPDIENKIQLGHLYYKKEIIPLLPVNKESKILEVGCGYGSLLLLLEELGFINTSGLDVSQEQIALAKQLGLTNVECTDAFEYLRNKEDAYDVIIGVDIIEHFSKNELMEFLSLAKAALKNNGLVIFRTPNGDAPFGSTYYFGDFTHEVVLNTFSAQQIMLTSGFVNVAVSSSLIRTAGILKNTIRALVWYVITVFSKISLFASGKSTKNVLFSPNLIIRASKMQ